MPRTLADLQKGDKLPPVPFELTPEWVQAYAHAVEDRAIGSVGADYVPPTAMAALAVRALLEQAALPPGAIHLGQELSFQRAVRTGARLRAGAEVVSRGERQRWVLMGVDLGVDEEGAGPALTGRATVTFPLDAEASA